MKEASLLGTHKSEADDSDFAIVPLVAAMFGKKKLEVSPLKSTIQADTKFLHSFGAGQLSDVRRGLGPFVRRLVTTVAKKVGTNPSELPEHLSLLEYIAHESPTTWMEIQSLWSDHARPSESI